MKGAQQKEGEMKQGEWEGEREEDRQWKNKRRGDEEGQ